MFWSAHCGMAGLQSFVQQRSGWRWLEGDQISYALADLSFFLCFLGFEDPT